jgi:hypothetical protein
LNLRVRDLRNEQTLFESSDPGAIAAYCKARGRSCKGQWELQYLDIHDCWSKLYAYELARLVKKAANQPNRSTNTGPDWGLGCGSP